MAPSITLSRDERIAIVDGQSSHNITLNGEPAYIAGVKQDFATVSLPNGGMSAEFAWPTVKYVIDNCEGAFRA